MQREYRTNWNNNWSGENNNQDGTLMNRFDEGLVF